MKIKDVAKAAGVSPGTVSRVFNNYSDISEATRKKVLEVARELNYVPNAAARTLSSKRTKKIAMIFSEFQLNQKNAIPLEMLSGVHDAASELGVEFVLLLISKKEQEEKQFATLCAENNITGCVIQGLDLVDPYYQQIQKSSIPTVLIDLSFESENSYSVSIDNYKASYEATEYLYEQGHRKIGMIAGKTTAMVSNIREAGYRDACKKLGIKLKKNSIGYAEFDEEIAYSMTEEYIKNNPEITAIFCASDLMAIGLMQKLQELGYRVPEDISVFGFDNLFVSNYVVPSLTTVQQNMYQIGKEAGIIANKLMNNEYVANKKTYVPHEFIYRNSVLERGK